MHPLLLVGFLIVAVGVFAEAATGTATKTIKFTPKEKKKESAPAADPDKKPASDLDK